MALWPPLEAVPAAITSDKARISVDRLKVKRPPKSGHYTALALYAVLA
jgi:hypothetical protein